MNEHINNIINNPNSKPEQVSLVKEWLELGCATGGRVDYENVPQIFSADWEREILSQLY